MSTDFPKALRAGLTGLMTLLLLAPTGALAQEPDHADAARPAAEARPAGAAAPEERSPASRVRPREVRGVFAWAWRSDARRSLPASAPRPHRFAATGASRPRLGMTDSGPRPSDIEHADEGRFVHGGNLLRIDF